MFTYLNLLANNQSIVFKIQAAISIIKKLIPNDITEPTIHSLFEFKYTPQKHITKYQQNK